MSIPSKKVGRTRVWFRQFSLYSRLFEEKNGQIKSYSMKCKKKADIFKVFLLAFSFVIVYVWRDDFHFTTCLFISVKRGAEDAGESDKKKPRLEVMTAVF